MKKELKKINLKGLSRSEWLLCRKDTIGGSDIGTILNLNKYKSPVDLWLEKTNKQEQQELNSIAIRHGNFCEDLVAELFAEEYPDFHVWKSGYMYTDGLFSANIDRFVGTDKKNPSAILEIKTANHFAGRNWEEDTIPESYYAQLQWYMGLLGIHKGYVAVLIGGTAYKSYSVDFSREFYDISVKAAQEFYDAVKNDFLPPAFINGSESCTAAINAMYKDNGGAIDLTPEIVDLCRERKIVDGNIKELEDRKNNINNLVKAVIGDAAVATYNGAIIATWKKNKDSLKFDESKFKDENPELHQKYISTKAGNRPLLIKLK